MKIEKDITIGQLLEESPEKAEMKINSGIMPTLIS